MFYLYICTMEVTEIVINGIIISTLDKPIGLEVIKLSLDRDFQYSCVDTKIEAELKFYCSSGKTELDEEYESKGVEGSGYIKITDTCGVNAEIYQFNLDFKKYNNQGEFTTIGLIDVNSLWKKDLDKLINLNNPNSLEDFYVRRLQLQYDYASQNAYGILQQDTTNLDLFNSSINILYNSTPPVIFPSPAPPLPDSLYRYDSFYLMPRVDETINSLEDSDGLVSDFIITKDFSLRNIQVVPISGAPYIEPTRYPLVEPIELMVNVNVDGEFAVDTNNTRTQIDISPVGSILVEFYRISEVWVIGEKFDAPRVIEKNILYDTSSTVPTGGVYFSTYSKSYSFSSNLKNQEKVWFYYECEFRDTITSVNWNGSTWQYTLESYILFNFFRFELLNEINANFVIKENTSSSISGVSDIEPYHTKIQALKGYDFLNTIFGTDDNIASTPCYDDLWFSRGDYLRGKINIADFIVKPSDFFRELEKVVCCGLGYFYDTPIPEKRLMSVYDFYSDTLVPSQYQFLENDLIDGIIEISPFLAPYYKEIQIGYSNSKDNPRDLCKQNNYSINNDSDTIYSKVSDFIASQYIITKALRLGTRDEELEYDNNIFLFSGDSIVSGSTTYNVTLSQTSGFLADNVFVDPNYNGINRRYATALNLFRHLYKWGFSLFANKLELLVKKYEDLNNYNFKIRDTTGAMPTTLAPNKADSYHGLSACYLPYDNPISNGYVNVDKTINDIYNKYIISGLYVPSQITFKTAKLSSLDLIAMRAHQYDLFKISDGVNTYYGNLISANLEDDVTEIKLLRRFKDGII